MDIISYNVNGFTSSQPYLRHLMDEFHFVCTQEMWLSGPELYRIDELCGDQFDHHSVPHEKLRFMPPTKGRGYGCMSIIWNKSFVCTPNLERIHTYMK